jgi:hypothetical protein
MMRKGDRAAEAERRLVEVGIQASVEGAGAEGEVAVIRPADGSLPALLGERRNAAIEECRAAGFSYVTLALY